LGLLGLFQILPAAWILLGNDPQRTGLIGLLALFYLLEVAWWTWLSRLPREVVYSALPKDRQSRDRAIADQVAQFDATYRHGVGAGAGSDRCVTSPIRCSTEVLCQEGLEKPDWRMRPTRERSRRRGPGTSPCLEP
jgi:hypothetical protein